MNKKNVTLFITTIAVLTGCASSESVELNDDPTAATAIQGEKTETEWHYFIYDEEKSITDVNVFDKEDCTGELEKYLEEYMK